jgi:hypothetical protein
LARKARLTRSPLLYKLVIWLANRLLQENRLEAYYQASGANISFCLLL